MSEQVCGKCIFCIKDDGEPYCVLKDLYTTVKLDDECDEYDFLGQKYFAAERNEG